MEKAHAQASEMEKQVARLKRDIEAQATKRGALEARCAEAEKATQVLNLKLGNLQENFDKQKVRIKRTERALQVAEGDLMKAQLEASSKLTKLTEKWIPAAKERMMSFAYYVQPYVELISAKIIEVYQTTMKNITPQNMKVQELTNSYSLEARRFSKPYADQIANVAKSHVEKLQVIWYPYHKLAVHSFKVLVKTTLSYHNQVEVTVLENLKKQELTKRVATKELSWFLASAIMAFPMFFLFRLLSAIFRKQRNCRRSTISYKASNNHKRKLYGK